MKKSYCLFACSFVLLLLVTSCQKSGTGPEGAKGDPGATGPAGPAGSTGTTGATGPAGSANVIYSAWFTPATYVKDTVFNLYGLSYTKSAPLITQSILDSGTVITYGKLLGYVSTIWPTTQVAQLPITVSYKFSTTGITYNDTWTALLTPGNLKIQFVDDENYYSSIANAHQFRYIIVPGGKAGGRLAQLSYRDICAMYHIPE